MRGAAGEVFIDWHRRLFVTPVRTAEGILATDVWCRVAPTGFEYRTTTRAEQAELAWWQRETDDAVDPAATPDTDLNIVSDSLHEGPPGKGRHRT